MDRIFVLLGNFRNRDCWTTLNDLFAKASYPQRVVVGLCCREDEPVALPAGIDSSQVRMLRYDAHDVYDLCRERHLVQQLWQDEEFVLCGKGHMRFAIGWDMKFPEQLAQCESGKPVLSHQSAYYMPPNVLEDFALPTYLKALPAAGDDILFEAERLAVRPAKPLRGAFVRSEMMFAKSDLFRDVPFDPYMDEKHADISFSLRLFTHGFDAFSPRSVLTYELAYEEAVPTLFALRGLQRFSFLCNPTRDADAAYLVDLDIYGCGTARSLADFEQFSGLDMQRKTTSARAEEAQFIPDLTRYTSYANGTKPVADNEMLTYPDDASKKEASLFEISRAGFGRNSIVTDAPLGVFIMRDYLDRAACARLVAYAEQQTATEIGVNSFNRDGNTELGAKIDGGRVTEHVSIDGIACDVINLFNDVFCHRVAPFFRVAFQYYERPQLLRYPTGGHYRRHADAECWDEGSARWIRTSARDYSVVLYINDDFEGGEFEFIHQKYRIVPEPGMLLAFPSDHRYMHAALPTSAGIRYALVSWAKIFGTPASRKWANLARIDIYQKALL